MQKLPNPGNETDNNCDLCIDNFNFVYDRLLKEKNCYEKCNFYYFIDESNNYFCTESNSCPDNYKLIKEKSECINECYNDNIYKFNYKNICYESCPNETFIDIDNRTCLKIPTTIISTIPNIIPTTIISTISKIIPTTIISTIPNQILSTNPSSTPSIIKIASIPDSISTTNPYEINTKEQTTVPIKMSNSINNKISSTIQIAYSFNISKYDFKNQTPEQIYDIIKNEIIKNYQKDW